jgi:AcrR family transcriptional regulator
MTIQLNVVRVRQTRLATLARVNSDSPPRSTNAQSERRGDVLWLRTAPDRPQRPAPLTRERIVTAAVDELDEHGAEALTMRRLARRLDVTAAALYWHVTTKDDVLDLAFDHVFGEVPLPEPGNDLHEDLRTLVLGWRRAMLGHPWSPALVGRPLLGPNVLARTEFLQATLARGGLGGIELTAATLLLANFTIGSAMTEATWHRSDAPATRAKAREHLTEHEELYPTLNVSGHLDSKRWSDDELFRRGLDQMLTALLPAHDRPAAHNDGPH